MGIRIRLLVPVWLTAVAIASSAGAAVLPPGVVVRVYDSIGLSEQQRRDALAVAGTALHDAGMTVDWRHCPKPGHGTAAGACSTVPAPAELIVRLAKAPGSTGKEPRELLGYALVVDGGGVFATVFADRVEWLARSSHTPMAPLLGHAVAHELGHLLLGTTGHSETGLMRAVWTADEIAANRDEDWLLVIS